MIDGRRGARLLDDLLGTLDERARYAVEARFGLIDGQRRSFREVGEDLGVTAEAARRLVKRAVAGLQDDAARILAAYAAAPTSRLTPPDAARPPSALGGRLPLRSATRSRHTLVAVSDPLDAGVVARPARRSAARVARRGRPRSAPEADRRHPARWCSPARPAPSPTDLGAGRRRPGVPAAGRRLRRELRGVLGRSTSGRSSASSCRWRSCSPTPRRARREGGPHRRPVRQAPVGTHRGASAATSCPASGATW